MEIRKKIQGLIGHERSKYLVIFARTFTTIAFDLLWRR